MTSKVIDEGQIGPCYENSFIYIHFSIDFDKNTKIMKIMKMQIFLKIKCGPFLCNIILFTYNPNLRSYGPHLSLFILKITSLPQNFYF